MITEIRAAGQRLGLCEGGLIKLARECAEDAKILEHVPQVALDRLRELLSRCEYDKMRHQRKQRMPAWMEWAELGIAC